MKVVVVALALCAAVASASASTSTGRPADIAARTRGAGRVVVAQVADVQARFDVNKYGDRVIVSQLLMEVEESLKGPHASVVPVDVEGGTIGGLTLDVSDSVRLKKGDRAVLFLDATVTPAGAYRPHQRGLGVLKLDSTNHVAGSSVTLDQIKAAVRAAAR